MLHKHKFKKFFGQNFLTNPVFANEIINLSKIDKETHVLEIGPGLGYLTKFLLEHSAKVTAVEIDFSLIPKLLKKFSIHPNFELINEDILKINLDEIFKDSKKICIVGSLPFNISKKIIRKTIDFGMYTNSELKPFTFIVQDEVANLYTNLDNKLGVIYQHYCNVKKANVIPASAFTPKPKVNGAILCFEINKKQKNTNFETLVKQAFTQPRKTLYNNLKKAYQLDNLERSFKKLNLNKNTRAAELNIDTWEKLAEELSNSYSYTFTNNS
ncbi:MAG: ribosomal RNA small subunit methyltransferase A [Candidatus Dojkabacteria bacterium]|nr:MAG: ribosomal RNA small subunit methyltransferase A [Candidatus Dojkabacteria bacterium]